MFRLTRQNLLWTKGHLLLKSSRNPPQSQSSLLSPTEPDKEQRRVVTFEKGRWAARNRYGRMNYPQTRGRPTTGQMANTSKFRGGRYCPFALSFPSQPFQSVENILSLKAVQKPVLDCTSGFLIRLCTTYWNINQKHPFTVPKFLTFLSTRGSTECHLTVVLILGNLNPFVLAHVEKAWTWDTKKADLVLTTLGPTPTNHGYLVN